MKPVRQRVPCRSGLVNVGRRKLNLPPSGDRQRPKRRGSRQLERVLCRRGFVRPEVNFVRESRIRLQAPSGRKGEERSLRGDALEQWLSDFRAGTVPGDRP